MKKSLKFLMLAVFVSFAFVLSACGEGQLGAKAQANIGNEADYAVATEADVTALTDYIAAEDSADAVTAYRMTMEMTSSYMEGMSQTMKYNAVISVGEEDVKMAVKLESSYTMLDETEEGTVYLYYDAGVIAMEMKGEVMGGEDVPSKIKVTLPEGQKGSDFYLVESLFEMNLGGLLELLAEEVDFAAEGVEVKVNTQGNLKRFQINAEVDGEQGKIYLVFEDNQLTQYQMEAEGMKVVLEAFDGEVEIPSFDGYADFNYEDLFGM